MTAQGRILKALSGFYYVDAEDSSEPVVCRARGKLRHQKVTPLVGDRVRMTRLDDGTGMVDEILERSNEFQRPAVANMEQLVIIVSGVTPISDPFLIDRVVAIAESKGCEPIICINKCDLNPGDELFRIYETVGLTTLRVSAETGEGIPALRDEIAGKLVAFTGNSGVGKSSILNALAPGLNIQVGEVSEKLGRGRHTTRHVELFRLQNGAMVADTPGFSAFDSEQGDLHHKEALADAFREFRPYLDACQFIGCSHRTEKGCAVLAARAEGKIPLSRHASYVRLYDQAKEYKDWEHTK